MALMTDKFEYMLRDNFLGGFTKMVVTPGVNGTIQAHYNGEGGGDLYLTLGQWRDLLVAVEALAEVDVNVG